MVKRPLEVGCVTIFNNSELLTIGACTCGLASSLGNMSNDLSYDGDSDAVYEPLFEKPEESFTFDASSHLVYPKSAATESEFIDTRQSAIQTETARIRSLHSEIAGFLSPPNAADKYTPEFDDSAPAPTTSTTDLPKEDTKDSDNRSIYVGNVDYSTTVQELGSHFSSCGSINRITIACDKSTGMPKGFAYIEFSERDAVLTAVSLNETLFKGRIIKVFPKRTNIPGLSTSDRGVFKARGRGSRGRGSYAGRRGRFRGGFRGSYRGSRAAPY